MRKCNIRTWLTNFSSQKYDSDSYDTLKAAGWTFWTGKTEKVHSCTAAVGELLGKISSDVILDNFYTSIESRIVEATPVVMVRFMKMPSLTSPYFSDVPIAIIKMFGNGEYTVVDCDKVLGDVVCNGAEDAVCVLSKILTQGV